MALLEWLVFAVVAWGVRRFGTPLHVVLGAPWQTTLQVLRHFGIAVAFVAVSWVLLAVPAALLHAGPGRYVQSLLPRTEVEVGFWLALSVNVGICEEAIFRGYLQRQFTVLVGSAPAGIALSVVIFGVLHAYQGLRQAALIALHGSMFGILTYWCKSARPGIVAHALNDAAAVFYPA